MGMEMPSGMLNKKICAEISRKAEEKKLEDEEAEKSGIDKAREKIGEGGSRIMQDADQAR